MSTTTQTAQTTQVYQVFIKATPEQGRSSHSGR